MYFVSPSVLQIVRPGDVFALLVEYYFHNGNIEQAYHLVESMKQRGIHAPMYLDEGDVTVIYQEMGVDPRQALERKQPATFSSGGGQVAEPVPDELDIWTMKWTKSWTLVVSNSCKCSS